MAYQLHIPNLDTSNCFHDPTKLFRGTSSFLKTFFLSVHEK